MGLKACVSRARVLGRTRECRSQRERVLLRQAISAVDRVMPGGANCYRRVLLEIALDAGAAAEPVMLGFRSDGGAASGHAWLAHERQVAAYDTVLSV
jgi:hypothetical protein